MSFDGAGSLIGDLPDRETLDGGLKVIRHRHLRAYVAVVLEGGYQEAGEEGRFSLRAGDALVHRSFEAHKDDVASRGAKILNLPGMPQMSPGLRFTAPDLDRLVTLASTDRVQAAKLFAETAVPYDSAESDWPDLLADRLRSLSEFRLTDWACEHGLAPETISRGFAKAYGVTPQRYRAEVRARRAVERTMTTDLCLSHISADLSFSDQSHMTRAVKVITGHNPGYWRQVKASARRVPIA